MNPYSEQISHIETLLEKYYETDFKSGSDAYEENRRLKGSLLRIIDDAKGHLTDEDMVALRKKVFEVLSVNTGSAKDVEILDQISAATLSKAEVEEILSHAPVQRWY